MNDIHKILKQNKLDTFDADRLDELNTITAADVKHQLAQSPGKYSQQRLATLLSPAAADFLEPMAIAARDLTVQRFGRAIQLYAPLYVSNYCINSCRYCGYNCKTSIDRIRLTIDQAVAEADIIASQGYRHILLVSGEDPKHIGTDYFCELVQRLKQKFSSISVEIYPMTCDQYKTIFAAGIDGVTLYQETYDRQTYADYHLAGPKSDYDSRLDAHDRTASAGMRRIGLGVLLGLADFRLETLAMAEHAAYLMKKYWRAQLSFSFPRLRPVTNAADDYKHLVSDAQMLQMMLALRLCFADTGIVLSTREPAELRDNLIKICVNRISAGSKTNPGGYSGDTQAAEQFQISDDRSPAQMAKVITAAGLEPVWKDWDSAFSTNQ